MKEFAKWSLLLVLALALAVSCSQKSGSQEVGAAPDRDQLKQEGAPAGDTMAAQQPMAPAEPVQPQAEMAPAGQPAAQVSEIRGTVVKTEDGIVIFSDAGSFLVEGQDLSHMVGRNVKATGTVEEKAERPTITLSTITLIE